MLSMAQAVGLAYGPAGRWGLAVIIVLASTTFMAAQLVALGQVAETFLHWPLIATVSGFGALVLVYSIMGGYRAVVVTDVAQLALVATGLAVPLAVFGVMSVYGEGVSLVAAPSLLGDGATWQPNSVQLGTVLTFVLGWIVAPEMWQRMQSLAPGQDARKAALWGVALLMGLFGLIMVLAGLASQLGFGAADVTQHGSAGVVWGALAQWVHHPGLQTVMLLGVVCAIASTLDSTLNVGSMVLATDVWAPTFKVSLSPLRLSRLAMVAMMVGAWVIAVRFQDVLHILWLSADFYASVVALPVVVLLCQPNHQLPSKAVARAGRWAMGVGATVTVVLRVLPLAWPSLALPTWPWSTLWAVLASTLTFVGVWRLARR